MMKTLTELLDETARKHKHLCPRQVLGVRMGLYGGEILGISVPQADKRLITFMETDGCGADGVSVATNCWVGRRTMRIVDFGKLAATFVDSHTGRAVRIAPQEGVRRRARDFAPKARNKWEAQLLGYQRMPAGELLAARFVALNRPIEEIISRPGRKAICERCGEEIMNEREVVAGGQVMCLGCAGQAYYHPAVNETVVFSFPLATEGVERP